MKNFTILSDLHITILRPIIMQLSSMIVHIFFASFLILELEVPILWEQLTRHPSPSHHGVHSSEYESNA